MSEHATPAMLPASKCPVCSLASDEYARLRAYAEEFARLVAIHDRTPDRWKHFQTKWLWLFAQGMIAAKTVSDVRSERLAELDQQHAQQASEADEEAAILRRSTFHCSRGNASQMFSSQSAISPIFTVVRG